MNKYKNTYAPVLKLELESLKYQVLHAFQDYNNEFNKLVEKHVEEYLKEDAVLELIKYTVQEELSNALKEAVISYFRKGKGKELIEQGVESWVNPKEAQAED